MPFNDHVGQQTQVVGIGQAPAVAALMTDAGFTDVEIWKDLAGTERVVGGRVGRDRAPASARKTEGESR